MKWALYLVILFSFIGLSFLDAKPITDLPKLPNHLEEWMSQPYSIKVNYKDISFSYPYASSEESIPKLEQKLLKDVLSKIKKDFPIGYKVIEQSQLVVFNKKANDHNIMFIHDPCTGEFLSYWITLSRRIKIPSQLPVEEKLKRRKHGVCSYQDEYIKKNKDCQRGQFVETQDDYDLEKQRLYDDLKFVVQSWNRYQKKRSTKKLPNEYFKSVNFFFDQTSELGNGVWYELFDYKKGKYKKSKLTPRVDGCFIDPVAHNLKEKSKEFYLEFYECGQKPDVKSKVKLNEFSSLKNTSIINEAIKTHQEYCVTTTVFIAEDDGIPANADFVHKITEDCLKESLGEKKYTLADLNALELNGGEFDFDKCEVKFSEIPGKSLGRKGIYTIRDHHEGSVSDLALRSAFFLMNKCHDMKFNKIFMENPSRLKWDEHMHGCYGFDDHGNYVSSCQNEHRDKSQNADISKEEAEYNFDQGIVPEGDDQDSASDDLESETGGFDEEGQDQEQEQYDESDDTQDSNEEATEEQDYDESDSDEEQSDVDTPEQDAGVEDQDSEVEEDQQEQNDDSDSSLDEESEDS